jgi:hypothetical protein
VFVWWFFPVLVSCSKKNLSTLRQRPVLKTNLCSQTGEPELGRLNTETFFTSNANELRLGLDRS